MNISRSQLKQQAKEQMNGKFGALFLCFFVAALIGFVCTKGISFLIMPKMTQIWLDMINSFASTGPDIEGLESELMSISAISNISNVLSIAYWFLVFPVLTVGLSQVLLNLTYGDVPSLSTVFEPYKTNFGKSIGTVWLRRLFEILWKIPFVIVSFIISIAILASCFNEETIDSLGLEDILEDMEPVEALIKALVVLLAAIFVYVLVALIINVVLNCIYSIVISAYAMAIYVMNENPDYSSTQCIEESKKMMKGHKWEFFVLKLSFIPWFLLCLIPFVGWLSLIYIIPYMQVTYTNFYHNIKPVVAQAAPGYGASGDIAGVIADASDRIVGADVSDVTVTDNVSDGIAGDDADL